MSEQPNAGQLLAALAAAQEKCARIGGELKAAKEEEQGLIDQIMVLMDGQETSMLSAAGLVAEITEKEVPQLVDWVKLVEWAIRHKRLDIFQRRLSPAVWESLLEERDGVPVPGIAPFTKRNLSVRKAKKGK